MLFYVIIIRQGLNQIEVEIIISIKKYRSISFLLNQLVCTLNNYVSFNILMSVSAQDEGKPTQAEKQKLPTRVIS